MRILFITNVPSPYRVDFFNELGKSSELTVLFEKSFSAERDDSWKQQNFINFNGIMLKGKSIGTDKALCFDMIKYLKKEKYDHIIVSNALTPTGIVAVEYMNWKKIRYLIESDGAFPKSGKGLKERFKKHIISGAKGWLSTAKCHDQYYLMYGANEQCIYRYPFTSLYNREILQNPISNLEREQARYQLGMSEEKIILSVGRFVYEKGYDILLQSCANLDPEIGVYIVGGEPTPEYINIKKKMGLHHIHFIGFKEKEELSKYYKAANVFVLPTRGDAWGLVINEAMAKSLPVITTDRCVAGVELVKDHVNGYIVPVGDSVRLSEKINVILNHDELQQKMSQNSLKRIQRYTIENMAQQHMRILETICS